MHAMKAPENRKHIFLVVLALLWVAESKDEVQKPMCATGFDGGDFTTTQPVNGGQPLEVRVCFSVLNHY